MSREAGKETLVEQKGRVAIVENVPARVCEETGE